MSERYRFRSFAISIYMVLEHVKQWLLIWGSISIHLHRINNRGTSWSAVCCSLSVFKVRKDFPQNSLVFALLCAFCVWRFCSSLWIFRSKLYSIYNRFQGQAGPPQVDVSRLWLKNLKCATPGTDWVSGFPGPLLAVFGYRNVLDKFIW